MVRYNTSIPRKTKENIEWFYLKKEILGGSFASIMYINFYLDGAMEESVDELSWIRITMNEKTANNR